MSFNSDPYVVMTVVKHEDGTFSWMCDGCGGGWRIRYSADAPLTAIRAGYDLHLKDSHKLKLSNTKKWHKGF